MYFANMALNIITCCDAVSRERRGACLVGDEKVR
jgi:hypothetical protein